MNQTEFVFDTFEEANNVHKKLFEIRRQKGYVTCADLFALIHVDYSVEEVLNAYCKDLYQTHGWTDLWNVKVEPAISRKDGCINGDWILKMPQIKIINKK